MNQPDWLKTYAGTIARGNRWTVVEETKHHALVRIPGSTYFTAIGMERAYSPVEYVIVRKGSNYYRDGRREIIATGQRLTNSLRTAARRTMMARDREVEA